MQITIKKDNIAITVKWQGRKSTRIYKAAAKIKEDNAVIIYTIITRDSAKMLNFLDSFGDCHITKIVEMAVSE